MDELKRQALAAYEKSRIRLGLRRGAAILPFIAIAGVLGTGLPVLAIGVITALLTGWMGWYGRGPGRGVIPGLLGGSIAFAAPLFAQLSGLVSLGCGATPMCMAATIAGGVGAGVLIAMNSKARDEVAWSLLPMAGLAALTCLPLGGSALLAAGMTAAITAPVVRLVRPVTA